VHEEVAGGAGGGEEQLDDMPSDLMAAMLFLRSQLRGMQPPVVLRTQLGGMMGKEDVTEVERELDALRIGNRIRVIKLNTGVYEPRAPSKPPGRTCSQEGKALNESHSLSLPIAPTQAQTSTA
jgi:hypothetical protein